MIPETKRSVAALLDITKRKQAEDELRGEKTFTESALNSLSDIFFVFDLNGKFLRWNKKLNTALGYSDAEISSMQPGDFFLKEDVQRVLDAIEKAVRDGYTSVEARVLTKDGRNIPYDFSGRLLKNHEGKPVGICGIGRDITERKLMAEKLQYLAYYDALTDLPNRNLFLDRVNQAIARAQPTSRVVAVLITNIDRFKSINDTYGSEIGDRVLKEIAGRLSTSVRKGDTIARLSNDEFGIALLDVAHTDDIVMVLEKIMKGISYPLNIAGDELALTFSTGVSLYPNDGNSAAELLKAAGLALGTAKKERIKPYQFFTEDLNIKASELILMEKGLLKAITNEEFILHYQPYWDITTKNMVGMEALVRWQSKDKGLVPPGKFISVLEDTGMIIEVGEWILREATRQVKEWQNKGYPVVPVSVNMSLVQFRQKDLAGMVKKIMKDSGYYPSLLTLEITESAFMQDIEFTKSVLTAMKELGCSVSIDDFGTGYSSLAYLKRFPVDNLKIDISFIREVVRDPDSASIVMAIINMAHTLNLKTIAEGIETEEQWNFLRLLRCDMGQGFYLSKPLPAEDIEKLFISNV
jgi:diguanylate cyclase (GGDEF)-like protein/PAS domain S-box-containing protein